MYVCILLTTELSPFQVAEKFRNIGWRLRKCSWDEYEIRSEYAELIIHSARPILMSGEILESRNGAESILSSLRESGIGCDAELYDEGNQMIQELKWLPE